MFPRFDARPMRAVTKPPSSPFQTTSMPITRAICGCRSPLYRLHGGTGESAITLVAVASSGSTEFPAAWWAERQQARSAAEHCLGRVRVPRPAPAPVFQPVEADSWVPDWGPPELG